MNRSTFLQKITQKITQKIFQKTIQNFLKTLLGKNLPKNFSKSDSNFFKMNCSTFFQKKYSIIFFKCSKNCTKIKKKTIQIFKNKLLNIFSKITRLIFFKKCSKNWLFNLTYL